MGEGENVGYQHFLLPQCFQKAFSEFKSSLFDKGSNDDQSLQ